MRSAIIVPAVAAALAASSTARAASAAAMLAQARQPVQESSRVVTRRVWAGDGVELEGSPSPDGRYLSFTHWGDPGWGSGLGNLAMRDLVTGQNRDVTDNANLARFAENSAFSPDGRSLAYSWWNDSLLRFELRLIGVDGTGLRVLVSDSQVSRFGPADWSADGRHIAVGIQRMDRVWALALVTVETGALRILRSVGWRGPWKVSLSRDGRFVAYDLPPSAESRARDVYVVGVDGRFEARATNHPANDEVLGWAPDGRTLFFLSDREGTEGVWALPMRGGRAAGAPTSVRRDLWHSSPLGFSRDSYFYGVILEAPSLYTALVDPERGQVVAPAALLEPRLSPVMAGDWSPDGRRIAVILRGRGAGAATLAIQSLNNGGLREIPADLEHIGPVGRPRWTPDARSVILIGQQRGRSGIYRVELATGRAELLVPGGNPAGTLVHPDREPPVYQPEPSPDGRTLYFVRGRQADDSTNYALMARDLESGAERMLCRCWAVSLAVSPDGSTLAFVPRREAGMYSLRVLPAQGGMQRVLYETAAPMAIQMGYGGLAWSRDGRSLLFARKGGNESWDLMVIPASGGEPRKLLDAPSILHLRVHPDGRRVVWGRGGGRGEVWVMENMPGMGAATGRGSSR